MTQSERIKAAVSAGELMPSAATNIEAYLDAKLPGWVESSISELVDAKAWGELNDRFYRELEFGTGGIRGRTIGMMFPKAEMGTLGSDKVHEHAAVGSNMLNDFTLARAVIGLFEYTREYLEGKGDSTPPRLVVAHDVRFYSRHFCELAASIWTKKGGDAWIFDGPRPTPQLSFAVRHLKAHAGAVITASHNPPSDNGFKAYFVDGAQVIPPHDKGIVAKVNAVPLGAVSEFLNKDLSRV
ncbi:MAG TPA: phospho-sugar mutase, partial [Opitutaceae bacterium]